MSRINRRFISSPSKFCLQFTNTFLWALKIRSWWGNWQSVFLSVELCQTCRDLFHQALICLQPNREPSVCAGLRLQRVVFVLDKALDNSVDRWDICSFRLSNVPFEFCIAHVVQTMLPHLLWSHDLIVHMEVFGRWWQNSPIRGAIRFVTTSQDAYVWSFLLVEGMTWKGSHVASCYALLPKPVISMLSLEKSLQCCNSLLI